MAGLPVSRQRLSMELQRNEVMEDSWCDFGECVRENIEETESKLDQMDDEVWCKLIIMEKNRRVAKVLLRRAVNLINNSDVGYNSNGIIGLNGFQNILREKETKETLRKVGKGCRIGMDKGANILVSKLTKCPMSCRRIGDIKGQYIEDQQKQTTLFDMKQFQQILRKELTKETPDIPQLKNSLVTTIEFSEHCDDPLEQPLWILIINIVAMDLLRSKVQSLVFNNVTSNSITIKERSDNREIVEEEEGNSGKCNEDVYGHFGHPISWHFTPPVPPIRNSSRLS